MEITQRNAKLDDADLLLRWRNLPSTRKFSRDSRIIGIEEHLGWLTARLGRIQLEPFFVFEIDDAAIGMSRLDIMIGSSNKFEVSISVDPDHHGKGVGKKVLNMVCTTFFGSHPDHVIFASVHNQNIVSQKLFAGAGFDLESSAGDFLYFEKKCLN